MRPHSAIKSGLFEASVLGPILILAFCNLCSFADRQLTSILAVPISNSLNLDHAHMALLGGTAFAVLYGVAGVPAGLAADRWSRRYLIAGAVAFWSVCTALCGLSSSFPTLFLARLGVGVGEAMLLPCAFSLIHDITEPEARGRAIALFGLGIPAGAGLGLIAGGVLNDFFATHPQMFDLGAGVSAWQKTFLFLALLGLPATGLALWLPAPARRRRLEVTNEIHRTSAVAIGCYFLALALAGILIQGAGFWLPSLFMAKFKMTTAAVGLRFGLITIIAVTTGIVLVGGLTDAATRRLGPRGAALVLILIFAAMVPAAAAIAGDEPWEPWIGVVLLCVVAGGLQPVSGALALRVAPDGRTGLMAALYGLVVNVCGYGFGPPLYGWLQDATHLSASPIVGVTTVALAILATGAAVGLAFATPGRTRPISVLPIKAN